MTRTDSTVSAHLEWLGFVQPKGLVVSPIALQRAGATLESRDTEGQRLLRECVESRRFAPANDDAPCLPCFRSFAQQVLGWSFSPRGYCGTEEQPVPDELRVFLADYGTTLAPDFAVRELSPAEGSSSWQLLVQVLEPGQDFDTATRDNGQLDASPHGRMERLLRQTSVPAGLLFNGRSLRLISAPRGESSGWLDFAVAEMVETAGRPICAALRLLLSEQRLLALPTGERLAALLAESRLYQNEVSERLAEQVLHALYELVRGLQAAHDQSRGQLLADLLRDRPDEIYHSLLTVLMRLVFILYAEERDMLPRDNAFVEHYSLASLFERLREDAALYPDTMDQRFGAWAQLLVLFRLVHDGDSRNNLKLPPRYGVLFDPDRYPFLEGRIDGGARQINCGIEVPLVPDGTVYRALRKLMVLEGERISYRALDVEQIGSVYETMMGFRLERATGRSIAIKAQKKHGAPTTIDLEALLGVEGGKRKKWLVDRTSRKPSDKVAKATKAARTLEELHAALEPIADRQATPELVPKDAMVLQPSEDRRKSGSHYTPQTLTRPIVRATLRPVLDSLRSADGQSPEPEQILALKVCDPAMGSGAFLVETCRQLADALIEAWHTHNAVPEIPPDEDEVLLARRMVAKRCLYGVDRNEVAVDLAKMSIWLVTLARQHELLFLDHALRHGDSLVGLDRRQLDALHWDGSQPVLEHLGVREPVEQALEQRLQIRQASESVPDWELRDSWKNVEEALALPRLAGDLTIAAFFRGKTKKARETARRPLADVLKGPDREVYRQQVLELKQADPPLVPFHWQIEFPEVFEGANGGFDAIVGNPPFAGKNTMANANVENYPAWLQTLHEESHGNSDLVAHFFRRSFNLLRDGGTLGLIATNTIGQGDTRSTGLRWICQNGGSIYEAKRRVQWPGLASVIVSVVHIAKGDVPRAARLDDREVDRVTAFLFHRGGHEDPAPLAANAGKSFQGSIVLGMGFTFDDTDKKGAASSLAEMHRLIDKDPRNADRIFPYIGGKEVNTSPTHAHHRYVINFGDMTEEEARAWPDLMAIVEEKVKPERMKKKRESNREYWWRYGEHRPGLNAALETKRQVLVTASSATTHHAFARLSARLVFSHKLIVLTTAEDSDFAVLQSQTHEAWRRLMGATMGDALTYNPTDVFLTFPFPANGSNSLDLGDAGREYEKLRGSILAVTGAGLTATYNRFHDPLESDPDIEALREHHSILDRTVLDAYGWTDIPTECEFLLDYPIDEETWSPRKKKPYRYRWPDEVRDEVLARLLELNAERAAEERQAGGAIDFDTAAGEHATAQEAELEENVA